MACRHGYLLYISINSAAYSALYQYSDNILQSPQDSEKAVIWHYDYEELSCGVGSQIKESTRWHCFSLFINQIHCVCVYGWWWGGEKEKDREKEEEGDRYI